MSNTFSRSSPSASVSKSSKSVANPASTSVLATNRLRGLWRLLPLPWAKSTTPRGFPDHWSVPRRVAGPIGMATSREGSSAGQGLSRQFSGPAPRRFSSQRALQAIAMDRSWIRERLYRGTGLAYPVWTITLSRRIFDGHDQHHAQLE